MSDLLRDQLQATLGTSYTLERELGGGGMSRVFVAEETRFGRRVVVKLLSPALAAGLSAERFEREIALAAKLQHPHIVPLIGAGETADGLPYYTMPFVAGESLRTRLAAGAPLRAAEAVGILRDVAKALAYAHGQGVVHRDVKPENVLLTGEAGDSVVVTDFGIAKALADSRTVAPGGTLTIVGTSLGTPAYMAPEQATGDVVDQRADLYAWGVMAYELLAGRHPFAGKTSAQQLIAAHIAEVPSSLASAAPRLPLPLVDLVMSCLAKDPHARPESARALLQVLEGVTLSGDQLTTARGTGARARPTAGGIGRRTALLAAVAMLAIVTAVAAAKFARGRNAVRSAGAGGTLSAEAGASARVAVAPFENRSGDAALGQLALLAQDQIARRLAETGVAHMLRGMDSVSGARTLARAREIGATYLVAGSLFRVGDRVQARADLVDVASGEVRRSIGPESAPVADGGRAIALLQERVTGTLALMLDRSLDDAIPPAAAQTPTYAAFREFASGEALAGQSQWAQTLGPYLAAYRLDSTFTFAAVRLARAYYNAERCDLADSLALSFARRDRMSEYEHAVLDRTIARCRGDWTSAYTAAKRMAELAPASSDARFVLGVSALYLYRADEALRTIQSSTRDSGGTKHDAETYGNIARALHMLARFADERALGDRMEREFSGSDRSFEVRLLAASALGDTTAALRIVEQLTTLPVGTDVPVSRVVLAGARELYRHGHPAAQRRVFELLVRRFESTPTDRRSADDGYCAAQAYIALGRWDEALAASRRAADVLGIVAARRGHAADAERQKRALLAMSGPDLRGAPTLSAATIAGALGQKEETLRLLQRSLLNGQHSVDEYIDARPEFALLWGDPRFEALFRPRT